MGSPIGVHADGSNCYTINCSLQGHSPIGISKEAFIAELQKENEKHKWDKDQHVMKNSNSKYFLEPMENQRWYWSEDDKKAFIEEVKAEVNRLEEERFVTKGYEFDEDVILFYAGIVTKQAEDTVKEKPEWKAVAEAALEADKDRREAWFSKENITSTPEYAQEFDKYMNLGEIKEDWEKENLRKDMKNYVTRVEEARYRRSTDWRAPSFMFASINPNIMAKPKRVKKYVERLLEEAYIESVNLKLGRDAANGKDIEYEKTYFTSMGANMGTVVSIMS